MSAASDVQIKYTAYPAAHWSPDASAIIVEPMHDGNYSLEITFVTSGFGTSCLDGLAALREHVFFRSYQEGDLEESDAHSRDAQAFLSHCRRFMSTWGSGVFPSDMRQAMHLAQNISGEPFSMFEYTDIRCCAVLQVALVPSRNAI